MKSRIVRGAYVIVRSAQSGVHAGILERRDGTEVVLRDSRRIWYWKGAATLSELALRGPACPVECRFAAPLPEILVLGVCEIIPAAGGRTAIEAVPEWEA